MNINSLLTISFRFFHLYKSFFHLSLAVLFRYRLPKIFSCEGGNPQFSNKNCFTSKIFIKISNSYRTNTFFGNILRMIILKHICFRSPLFTKSRLIFTKATKMFQFALSLNLFNKSFLFLNAYSHNLIIKNSFS